VKQIGHHMNVIIHRALRDLESTWYFIAQVAVKVVNF
jgi:hypothetical protein